ncbi:DUF2231 domain-containing protein [Clavibacter sepedonicus]|uniref:Integral membrane protein n=1 Tax=Clavibacter sepedonicus TaxID=31964 RepID=B0RBR1_CLASE|nr:MULTISPECIES: DUF2231 domain-containing protein [Clavibacter]MBD5382175.1 hypothetical protein [Clavibacter sp.]OQJ48891.1 hypothetical protein B5P19_12020 [Clavibacter sepedonicus]OQJ53798.1 hypothetical protein B5P20_06430 [Clavibacter sepedonicus]UUK65306.1 hypothetical protein LRE50_13660 [Clavibacter sepedonicus]CAQ00462.1 putative integral membrane protein [Clavibacter sepedonicus]
MSWQINGLPLHPLIVHFVVVAFPTAALLILVSALWPAFARRLGIITPLVALASLIAVPLATSSGENLEEKVGANPVLEVHTELGDTLLPWAVAVFVVAVAQWLWIRRLAAQEPRRPGRDARPIPRSRHVAVTAVLAVAVAVSSVGAIVTTVRIGESGARAVWSDSAAGGD